MTEKTVDTPAPPALPESLGRAALAVMETTDAAEKAVLAMALARAWRDGRVGPALDATPPDRPGRPDRPALLAPRDMPKRRKAGTRENRIVLLHAVAHIELNAIDLAFDMVLRFGPGMPRAFLDDWVSVGGDEGRHFEMLCGRLAGLGSFYGALPAHDGLWQAAFDTRNDLAGRLAVVPMVLEARGLDVTPGMIRRFETAGDNDSAQILRIILEEEVAHVAAGRRWLEHIAEQSGEPAERLFQSRVRKYFQGAVKPPFNTKARNAAGMPEDFYVPLVPLR